MNKSLVSIILPTYNRASIIMRAIASILAQTYINWELIIIDDGSTDNTQEKICEIKDARIIYVRLDANKGANYARNYGSKMAKGKYLAFIDSDNYWMENKIERQLELLENTPGDVALVFGQIKQVDGKSIEIIPNSYFSINNIEAKMRENNVIDTNAVLIKKEVFEKVGRFDEAMPRLQDYELFYRIIVVHKYKVIYIADVLDCNVLQANSISKDSMKLQKALILLIEKHHKNMSNEEILNRFLTCIGQFRNMNELTIFLQGLKKKDEIGFSNMNMELIKRYWKQTRYYETLYQWKEQQEKDKNRTVFSESFFRQEKVIALYGLGKWGEIIYNEMSNVGIKIAYGIDKKVKQFHDIEVVRPCQIPSNIDVIIVSLFQHFDEISNELKNYYDGEIMSIEDIIDEKNK